MGTIRPVQGRKPLTGFRIEMRQSLGNVPTLAYNRPTDGVSVRVDIAIDHLPVFQAGLRFVADIHPLILANELIWGAP